ncbi:MULTISPECIES: transcriptional regulator [Streptomyces]|uniref:Transcriptional regulator n=1 Tax=Streptomyces desertarenae TaxID=2666184 RepID=A0ABW4PRD5_9ACTN
MYDLDTRRRVLTLVGQGRSLNSVSRATGISRSTIRAWQTRIEPLPHPRASREAKCVRCAPEPSLPADRPAYAYLLGLYLGDGCISAHPRRDGHYLRIACADAWPGLITACCEAITAVLPDRSAYRARAEGCVMVTSYGHHWLCLFPQHGTGRKHERRITLESWQREITDGHPWELVRGLVHSDGCRITNWATRPVGGVRKRYEYPRYFFTNTSEDIVRLYVEALDRVGVEWKATRRRTGVYDVSVARRASVALMDEHIGPKH